jgi:RNA polymerase sigma factor (sigma-70 family)
MAAVTLGRGGAGPGHLQPGQGHAAADRAARLGASFEQARAGDQAAMREVVAQLNPLLWRVARAQGLATEEAADVVQTSWLELVRRLNDIRSPQALTAWLITATRREAWRVREQGRRHAPAPGIADSLDAVPDPGPRPGDRLLTDERDQALWRAFRLLSDRCRELLRIVAQVSRPDYTAVAEALGMPVGSIGPTRGRCLAKLRALLAADPSWSGP